MQTEYFQGKDGYIWWNGVVEDRKDPLMIGRCRVRILGWHTADKSELPTDMLPWAQVLMPITSASQTGAGEAPVGPVEGTWVMGFYRDGELAQEPGMVGTLPGVPENYAKQNTGFNDPRLDVEDADRHVVTKQGGAKSGAGAISLIGWPYPPKELKGAAGKEVTIIEYTNEERQELTGKSLYPRNLNEPTTSRYARGEGDDSSKVETEGIFALKNKNLGKGKISSLFLPSTNLEKNVPSAAIDDPTPIFSITDITINEVQDIQQAPSPYAAVYPFNHVYESESGHLIEVDDTPTKERLHWYHRSGTFTEFHPKGIRTDRIAAHHYHMVLGNSETIISGLQKRIIENESFTDYAKSKHQSLGNDFVVTSDNGDIILGAKAGHAVVAAKHVILDGGSTMTLNAPLITRITKTATDTIKGNYALSAQGGYNLQSGKLTLGSMGEANITTFGNITQTIGGSSEEIIANIPGFGLGNLTAKKIKTAFPGGKIVLESSNPLGGIDLNMSVAGAMSQISIAPPLGDITIKTTTAPTGITIDSKTLAKLIGKAKATIEGALIDIIADGIVKLEATAVNINGSSEPALLGKAFTDLFKKHQHDSPNGPTGAITQQYSMKITKTMSRKVFLG